MKLYEIPKEGKIPSVLHYKKIDKKSIPVVKGVSEETIHKMIRACLSDDGIGLAAPQIGIFQRVFVVLVDPQTRLPLGGKPTESTDVRVFINPSFEALDKEKEKAAEGCLSVPGIQVEVPRYKKIKAKWFENGQFGLEERTEEMNDLMARVFQHELDHLNGISIMDRGLF